jgi:hypothetical protein
MLRLAGCFALLFLAWPTFGQTERCGQQELKASLPPKAEAYSDAMALRESLSKHGIAVQCVLLSKMDGTFEGQMGAALYRTDRGDFEVLFLPPPNTFQLLKVVERQDGERYTYSFNGPPKPWPANRIDSAQRIYFIKHKNMLFVLSDKQLAATLENFARSAVNLAGGSDLT